MKHINDTDKAFFKVLAVILSSYTKDQLNTAENVLYAFEKQFSPKQQPDKCLVGMLLRVLGAKRSLLVT